MRNLLLIALLAAACLSAQTVTLNALEKEFQDAMQGVRLEGQSTRDGQPGISDDKYDIEKVVKTGDDQWTVYALIERRGQTITVPLPLQIKWAGDTPVITLTDQALPGMGTYTARVLIYRGQYAGNGAAATAAAKYSARSSKSNVAQAFSLSCLDSSRHTPGRRR